MLKNSYISCTTKAEGAKNPPHWGLINNRRLGTADLFLMRFLWDFYSYSKPFIGGAGGSHRVYTYSLIWPRSVAV